MESTLIGRKTAVAEVYCTRCGEPYGGRLPHYPMKNESRIAGIAAVLLLIALAVAVFEFRRPRSLVLPEAKPPVDAVEARVQPATTGPGDIRECRLPSPVIHRHLAARAS